MAQYSLTRAVGFNPDIGVFPFEDKLLYSVGSTLVLLKVDSNDQEFVQVGAEISSLGFCESAGVESAVGYACHQSRSPPGVSVVVVRSLLQSSMTTEGSGPLLVVRVAGSAEVEVSSSDLECAAAGASVLHLPLEDRAVFFPPSTPAGAALHLFLGRGGMQEGVRPLLREIGRVREAGKSHGIRPVPLSSLRHRTGRRMSCLGRVSPCMLS